MSEKTEFKPEVFADNLSKLTKKVSSGKGISRKEQKAIYVLREILQVLLQAPTSPDEDYQTKTHDSLFADKHRNAIDEIEEILGISSGGEITDILNSIAHQHENYRQYNFDKKIDALYKAIKKYQHTTKTSLIIGVTAFGLAALALSTMLGVFALPLWIFPALTIVLALTSLALIFQAFKLDKKNSRGKKIIMVTLITALLAALTAAAIAFYLPALLTIGIIGLVTTSVLQVTIFSTLTAKFNISATSKAIVLGLSTATVVLAVLTGLAALGLALPLLAIIVSATVLPVITGLTGGFYFKLKIPSSTPREASMQNEASIHYHNLLWNYGEFYPAEFRSISASDRTLDGLSELSTTESESSTGSTLYSIRNNEENDGYASSYRIDKKQLKLNVYVMDQATIEEEKEKDTDNDNDNDNDDSPDLPERGNTPGGGHTTPL